MKGHVKNLGCLFCRLMLKDSKQTNLCSISLSYYFLTFTKLTKPEFHKTNYQKDLHITREKYYIIIFRNLPVIPLGSSSNFT